MCGIAGWYRRDGESISAATIVDQCHRIVHRGPDDGGTFTDGDFGFGMRRLSIIDIAGGHQPMESPDGRYVIVFNGEIYNHEQLRPALQSAGYPFRTQSDTETLLAGFLHWGDDAWLRLEGMYAVAIWDRQQRSLLLARDPLGIKPLYLTRQQGGIAFASELEALRVLPGHRFDVDPRAVHDYFSFGQIQQPRSIFAQAVSLEPGHTLRVDANGGETLTSFWRPAFKLRHDLSEDDWIEETRARVTASVASHMLADVPVGAFVSGGIDSGSIAAIMSRSSERPIKAFTLGFPGTRIDETAAAARVAEYTGCEHIVLPMQPMAAAEVLPAVQDTFDEPCAATAAVPLWYLARHAVEHVKVVLCGDGGDELFAGYKRQRTARMMQRWGPALEVLAPLLNALDHLPVTGSRRVNYLRQNLRRFREGAALDSGFQRFFRSTQIVAPAIRERLYQGGVLRERGGTMPEYEALECEYFTEAERQTLDPMAQFLLADMTVHLPGSYLMRLDRATMAHSLEARVPFLSHTMVDWSMTMPMQMKLRGRVGKYVLRRAAETWLPPEILSSGKQGFQLPFAEWFAGDFSDFALEAWHSSGAKAAGYLDASAVDELFQEHGSGRANHGRILFAITMFSLWWDKERRRGAAGDARATTTLQPGTRN